MFHPSPQRRKPPSSSSSSFAMTSLRITLCLLIAILFPKQSYGDTPLAAFVSPTGGKSLGSSYQRSPRCEFLGRTMTFRPPTRRHPARKSATQKSSLNMFLGNDGGFFGVGAPEVLVITLVGYFVLGPSDLYKIVKEIGKFINSVRTLGTEATKTFETSMESQLELQELRKAQRDLTDAFSFRRSINFDETEDPVATTTEQPPVAKKKKEEEEDDGVPKKKKVRRRVRKKKPVEEEQPLEDLEMPSSPYQTPEMSPEEASELRNETARLREKRRERLEASMDQQPFAPAPADDDTSSKWFETPEQTQTEPPPQLITSPSSAGGEQNRFATQLSGDWNQQILANEDKLSPLSKIMERLAILEEEKMAADARIEEEFRRKTELEEMFYREKRDLLERAVAEVQADAYKDLGEVKVDGKVGDVVKMEGKVQDEKDKTDHEGNKSPEKNENKVLDKTVEKSDVNLEDKTVANTVNKSEKEKSHDKTIEQPANMTAEPTNSGKQSMDKPVEKAVGKSATTSTGSGGGGTSA